MSKTIKYDPLQDVDDDGMIFPEIGIWGEIKYRLVGHYCNLFTSAIKSKWGNIVYIDLFSGAGYAQIKENGRRLKTSALISLNLKVKFSHYIFSELDPEKFAALESRVSKEGTDCSYDLLNCDSNESIELIKSKIPTYRSGKGTLSFCFVDPFSLNLHFKTIATLAEYKVDFLILLALQMDARRNVDYYLNDQNSKIAYFLDDPDWRHKFDNGPYQKKDFMKFLADQYDNKMIALGYKKPPNKNEIKTPSGLSLYYLAFYSKHPLGNDFYKKVQNAATTQYTLF